MELADLMAHVESSGRQMVQRFERLHLGTTNPALVAKVAKFNGVSTGTADVYCAMSHGLYQIMGFNLYGKLGFDKSIMDFLMDTRLQGQAFADFLKLDGLSNIKIDDIIHDKPTGLKFAAAYNGPNNTEMYYNRLCVAYDELTNVSK